jgi:TldD protein
MTPSNPALDRLAIAKSVLLEPYGLDESHLLDALAQTFAHKVDY